MRERTSDDLKGLSARGGFLTASTWTAGIQLWSPTSLAHRAAGDGALIDAVNFFLLGLCAIGWVDLVLGDIFRSRKWASLPEFVSRCLLRALPKSDAVSRFTDSIEFQRHRFCIALYALLAAGFGFRSFIASGNEWDVIVSVGGYYLLFSVFVFIHAAALFKEGRERSQSK